MRRKVCKVFLACTVMGLFTQSAFAGRSHCGSHFSSYEDKMIFYSVRRMHEAKKQICWREIAGEVNKGRYDEVTGRDCYERYCYRFAPGARYHRNYFAEEDKTLVESVDAFETFKECDFDRIAHDRFDNKRSGDSLRSRYYTLKNKGVYQRILEGLEEESSSDSSSWQEISSSDLEDESTLVLRKVCPELYQALKNGFQVQNPVQTEGQDDLVEDNLVPNPPQIQVEPTNSDNFSGPNSESESIIDIGSEDFSLLNLWEDDEPRIITVGSQTHNEQENNEFSEVDLENLENIDSPRLY